MTAGMSNRKLASGVGGKKKDRNLLNHHDEDSNSKPRDERQEQVRDRNIIIFCSFLVNFDGKVR